MPPEPPNLHFTKDEVEAATAGGKKPWTRQIEFDNEINAEDIARTAAAYGRAAAEARNAQDLAVQATARSQEGGGLDGTSLVDGEARIDETRGGLQDGGADIDAVVGHLVYAMNLALATEDDVRGLIFNPQGLETKYGNHLKAAAEEWNGWVGAFNAAQAERGGQVWFTEQPPPLMVSHNGETLEAPLTVGGYALPDDLAERIRTKHLRLAATDAEATWDDIDAEIESYRRRMTERAGELGRLGYDVSAGPLGLFSNAEMTQWAQRAQHEPLRAEAVENASRALADAGNWDAGLNGDRDEIRQLFATLNALSPAELDAVISQATPEQLSRLNDLMGNTSDLLWYEQGLPLSERQDAVSGLLARVNEANLGKLTQAFPWMQPGFETTDAYLDGRNPQTGEQADGMHWGRPTDPLFAPNASGAPVSYDEIRQGKFGNCWYLASLIAVAEKDPEFIREGIQQNPNGTVNVRIWDQEGNERWVTVTPDLPMDGNGQPVGAYGNGETWPAYYEKAFALVYGGDGGGAPDGRAGDPAYDRAEQGSYGAIEWDYNEQAPPYLTGVGTENADGWLTGSYEGTVEASRAGHPVIVSTPAEAEGRPADWGASYSTRHVYYVLGVDEGTGEIILGNPWGSNYQPIRASQEEFERFFQNPKRITIPE